VSHVFLSPGAGDDAARMCEHAAAELSAHARAVSRMADGAHDGWLGDCEEGRGWAELLLEKSVGANSLRWLLERHAANLAAIASQFRCTTRPYGATDENVIGGQWSTP
jgi:hypothetical protein